MQLFAGRPGRYYSAENQQVTFSSEELQKMLGDTSNVGTGRGAVPKAEGEPDPRAVPGMLLNRLNPLKDLNEEERFRFVAEFRHTSRRRSAAATCASCSWTSRASTRR